MANSISTQVSTKPCPNCNSDNFYTDYQRIESMVGVIQIRRERCEQEGKTIKALISVPGHPDMSLPVEG